MLSETKMCWPFFKSEVEVGLDAVLHRTFQQFQKKLRSKNVLSKTHFTELVLLAVYLKPLDLPSWQLPSLPKHTPGAGSMETAARAASNDWSTLELQKPPGDFRFFSSLFCGGEDSSLERLWETFPKGLKPGFSGLKLSRLPGSFIFQKRDCTWTYGEGLVT